MKTDVCVIWPYLTQRLLQPSLFGHREATHRLPASAQLLHLNFDPGRVIVCVLDQLSGRTLQGLHAAGPLAQLFLEHLQVTGHTFDHITAQLSHTPQLYSGLTTILVYILCVFLYYRHGDMSCVSRSGHCSAPVLCSIRDSNFSRQTLGH